MEEGDGQSSPFFMRERERALAMATEVDVPPLTKTTVHDYRWTPSDAIASAGVDLFIGSLRSFFFVTGDDLLFSPMCVYLMLDHVSFLLSLRRRSFTWVSSSILVMDGLIRGAVARCRYRVYVYPTAGPVAREKRSEKKIKNQNPFFLFY